LEKLLDEVTEVGRSKRRKRLEGRRLGRVERDNG